MEQVRFSAVANADEWDEHGEVFRVAHPIRDEPEGQNVMAAYVAGLHRAAEQFRVRHAEIDGLEGGNWNNLGVAREIERLAESFSASSSPDDAS